MAEEKKTEVDWEKKYNDLLERHEKLIDDIFYEIMGLKKKLKLS